MVEDQWLAKYVYYNPRDGRLLVPWRGGRKYVLNCGKPLGLTITATAIALPILGFFYFGSALVWQYPRESLAIALPVAFVCWRVLSLLRTDPEKRTERPV